MFVQSQNQNNSQHSQTDCLNSQTDCTNTRTDNLDGLKEYQSTQVDGLDI